MTAISPWLWIVGAVFLSITLFLQFNFIVLLILIMSVPRLLSLFRKKSNEEKRFFEIERWQRVVMTLLYFGLIAALLSGMSVTQVDPRARPPKTIASGQCPGRAAFRPLQHQNGIGELIGLWTCER